MDLKVPEILAPAGGRAQFFAALNSGADAVYLGLKDFNARSRAENFTLDDLRELRPLADRFQMKILVTLNILIKEREIPDLMATLRALEEIEVHAIIVQDLAIASLVKQHFPRLRLHASTQMAVHNLAGVQAAAQFGFKRVVLARELTAKEFRQIRENCPSDVEIEAFCHGSLCYSYSGLCFFSGAGDGRSGNRGECAYTCRQPYKILNEPGHGFLFSMKDLDTSDKLDLLIEAGIDTLKIEGRKKDAQYVSSVVRLYRQRLDQIFGCSTLRAAAPTRTWSEDDLKLDLALSFHRRTTSLFVEGRYHENVIDLDNPTHQGVAAGQIIAVNGRTLNFKTLVALDRFDGVRIDQGATSFHALPQHGQNIMSSPQALKIKYDNEQCQFSLREIKIDNRSVFHAPAGATVTITCPPEMPLPQVGDAVWKVRSQALKERIEQLTHAPQGEVTKPFGMIDLTLALTPSAQTLTITATASKWDTELCTTSITVPLALSSNQTAGINENLQTVFAVLGDARLNVSQLKIEVDNNDQNWFVPRGKIKELKRQLVEKLIVVYPKFFLQRGEKWNEIKTTNDNNHTTQPAQLWGQRCYSIKCDRPETIAAVVAFCKLHPEFPLDEICFEPKRAFATALTPEQLALAIIQDVAQLQSPERPHLPLRLSLPIVVRSWDLPMVKLWTKAFAKHGVTRFELGNLGSVELLKSLGLNQNQNQQMDLATDFTLYTLNSEAAAFWQQLGFTTACLSIEDDRQNLHETMKNWPSPNLIPQVIIYKDTPLFIAEACSLTALHNGCPTSKVCGYRTLEIENPKGERFMVAHETCKSIVYGEEAYSITHHQKDLLKMGIKNFRVDFITRPYSTKQVENILLSAFAGQTLSATHSANYERELI
jgi:putative protease